MASPVMKVEVQPRYLAQQSSPAQGVYTFSYTITVTNVATVAIQLIARHWQISDDSGHAQEVKGLGVIGQQPLLQPGESFRYTSGCRIHAPSGTMHGSYFVVSEHGDRHDVPIPAFALEAGEDSDSDGGGGPFAPPTPRVLH